MCRRFNPNRCSRNVPLVIDPNYNGAGVTTGKKITISATYLRDYPRYDPSWLVEGIVDYARWKYGINNAAGGWSLTNNASGQYYTDSYRITAQFLVWCEKRYPRIVNRLDSVLRNNVYQANTWVQITGRTVDQLWSSYSSSPAL